VADGRTHDVHGIIAALLLAVGVGICHWQGAGIDVCGLPAGVVIGTLLLSPDLDMWNTGPIKRWGPLKYFWAPYAWAHSHRGLSHSWLLGPLVRLLYLGIPVALIWWHWDFEGAGPWIGYTTCGIILGSWIHLVGDRRWPRLGGKKEA